MGQINVGMGVLQETKITEGIYMQESAEYTVVVPDALSRHRGGMAIFY